MRLHLHLAAAILLSGAATTHAQITNPDALIAPPPAPPIPRLHPTPTDDLQWLWQYTKPSPHGQKSALTADPRFIRLLKDRLKTPQAIWGNRLPLSDAAVTFLAGAGDVLPIDNRYITISGCVVEQCEQRGLLWIDLGSRRPLLIFVALRWTEQAKTPDQPDAPFDLWIFSDRDLDVAYIPTALRDSISTWINPKEDGCSTPQPKVGPGIVVDQDGTPHVRPIGALFSTYICVTTSDPVITKQRKK